MRNASAAKKEGNGIKKRKSKQERRFFLLGLLFVSPWLIGFLCFQLYPILSALYYSFADFNIFQPAEFTGLDNYVTLFNDKYFPVSIKNTAVMSFIGMPIGLVVALALAVLLRWLAGQGHSQAHTLVLVNAVLLFLSGLCSTLGISTLLACMALGAGYVNLGGEKRLFKRMDKFSPPFLLLFFALSGLRLNIPSLATAGVIGVAYFFVRIAGKYAGASSGAALCRADPSIIKYLGLALTPQAGVSIGLAVLGQRMLPAAEGTATIILSSAVLYELTGPACAKLALLRSGAIPRPATRQPTRGHGRMPSMPDTGDTQEPPRAAG